MKVFLGVSMTFLLIGLPLMRQGDSVDLTQPPEPSKPTASQEKTPLPYGCKELLPGVIGDGWVEPEDNLPHDIVVEVVSVSNMKPALGSELGAEVQLRNTDMRPLQIPWSRDPRIIEHGQSPDALLWEVGTFEFTLKDQQGHHVLLKSLTESLYGTKFYAGSELSIKPGESITASVKFKLDDEFPIPPLRLKEGEWQLSAEWRQVRRTSGVGAKSCTVGVGYFQYDKFYRQRSPSLSIRVTRRE